MHFNFDTEKLPEIYIQDNRKYYLDPIRKKLIQITPEETVRQKWISFIKNKMNISERLISVETHLSHYGTTAIPLEIKTSSLIKIFHSCVVVLAGR